MPFQGAKSWVAQLFSLLLCRASQLMCHSTLASRGTRIPSASEQAQKAWGGWRRWDCCRCLPATLPGALSFLQFPIGSHISSTMCVCVKMGGEALFYCIEWSSLPQNLWTIIPTMPLSFLYLIDYIYRILFIYHAMFQASYMYYHL